MFLSVSSVFITLVITTVMITLFCLILFNKKMIFFLRSDLLIVLSFMIIFRLLLPVEWKFTITLPFSWVMNPFYDFLNYEIFDRFSVLSLLLMIWAIGSMIQIFRLIIQLKKIEHVFFALDKTAIKNKVSDYLDINPRYDYPVWIDSNIPFPMILGFKKIILIPDIHLEKGEFVHIIQHELEHLKHKDNMIKLFLNVLLIVYWWFPPIYWLCNRIQLVLEMRVDKKVTSHLSELSVTDYAQTLLNVQKALHSETEKNFNHLGISSTFYVEDGKRTLYYRMMYLLNPNYKKSTNILIILAIIFMPWVSNSFVLEPCWNPPLDDYSVSPASELEDGFILKHADGSYSFYIHGTMKEISEPDKDFLSQYPVISEEK